MAAVKRGIKSQIISVIEHIIKVRFGWLEDRTSIFFKLMIAYVKYKIISLNLLDNVVNI